VIDIARTLAEAGVEVQVHDPLASADETRHEYDISLTRLHELRPADAVVLAVSHQDYIAQGWALVQRLLKAGSGIVIDVKSKLDRAAKPEGVDLWRP
jgi:UDP-N-acetyl-D-galactosamine dehydrogenase